MLVGLALLLALYIGFVVNPVPMGVPFLDSAAAVRVALLLLSPGAALIAAVLTSTRVATGLVGPSNAADVVSDALVRLMASDVWADARNPRALLYRAVFYEAQMWHRAEQRRRGRDTHAAGPSVVEPPDLDPEVRAAVAALSAQQRAVVFLTYWEDLTPDAIGDLLGISDGAVRKHLARARSRLRETLR